MTVLVLYATIEGHTRKIAEHAAARLEAAGQAVFLGDIREPGFAVPGRFDGVLICAPIHIGRYPSPVAQFVTEWKDALAQVPTALVSVSLAIHSDSAEERAEAEAYPAKLEKKTGFHIPKVHHAAGALKFLEYDFFKRALMRRIAAKEGGPVDTSRDHEFTDWQALDAFVQEFADDVALARRA
ncbi:menaquinone-dependent protoporphyrinogen oxidase [Hoeflea halophila]|uniref:Menaquinone-dependent protoporphyrinogen oxidase n=1 Tax=Hoeflea halophila TaxID=714899 RepID=A0A286IEV2_9HYPH|nr:flavodoxin domain-containing protein [Hoeflea halophila]SOE18638.1 menaquinone-dependent protoporphyrinogen oxidase [Hoeflea halophila]